MDPKFCGKLIPPLHSMCDCHPTFDGTDSDSVDTNHICDSFGQELNMHYCITVTYIIAEMQPEQVLKVRGDLGVTQQNMAVFSEMLSELKPGLEHPEVCIFALKIQIFILSKL